MAFLYTRPRSPFFWIQYRDETGALKRHATPFRTDNKHHIKSAKIFESEKILIEKRKGIGNNPFTPHHFAVWVVPFLETRLATRKATLERYSGIWQNIHRYLTQLNITHPSQMDRKTCEDYIGWRTRDQPGLKACARNTAILETKIIAMVLREAVFRGYIANNPATHLGLKKDPPKEKPVIPSHIITEIIAAIQTEPEPRRTFLYRSFLISYHQGCRLGETYLNPMTDVKLPIGNNSTASIRLKTKGNRIQFFPLNPELFRFFADLKTQGVEETYPRMRRTQASRIWTHFWNRHRFKERLPGISHHCLRVTMVSNLSEVGVMEHEAMAIVGHSSTTVHRVYQRHRMERLVNGLEKVNSLRDHPQRPE